MSKTLKLIIFTMLLLGITTACNMPTGEAKATQTPTQALIFALNTPTPLPTAIPPSPTPEFAPFCNPSMPPVSPPVQCKRPIAKEITPFCWEKAPYNLIFANPNSTYQSPTPGFSCSYQGVKDNNQMITCTGTMLMPYEVTICDPACAIPPAQVPVTKCPQGYNYSDIQGCCTQGTPQKQLNCITLKLYTTQCIVECPRFNKTACLNSYNSYACVWDGEQCTLRGIKHTP
jgi:hypothetical protein